MSDTRNESDNIIMLTDGNGNNMSFEFLALIEYREKEYAILLPDDESADEVLILEIEHPDEHEEVYVCVDDEETLAAVFEIFKERFKDEFDFTDC